METLLGIPMDYLMIGMLILSGLVLGGVGFLAWRQPILARLALRNMPRRRAQSVLIIFGLMLATLLITAALGMGDTLSYSLRQAFTGGLGGIDLRITPREQEGFGTDGADLGAARPTFSQATLDELRAKVGADARIAGWSAELVQIAPLVNPTARQQAGQTVLRGIGPDLRATQGELRTSGGALFDPGTLRPGEIVLDMGAADKLAAQVGRPVRITLAGQPHMLTVRAIVESGTLSAQIPGAFVTLEQMQTLFQMPDQINSIAVALQGSEQQRLDQSAAVAQTLRGALDSTRFTVTESRKDALEGADTIGNVLTLSFMASALFSIAAGVLLIFLIFTMLAAERKSEMGMARAVGMQRGHLTLMFVVEGLAYDLAAAAVGVAAGVAVGAAMVGVIGALFGTFGVRITPHVEGRSLVVAYCLGMLITFATVIVSAWRVSHLNIVSAIRDLPDLPRPQRRLTALALEPIRQLDANQFTGCLGAVVALLWSLLASGPVTGTLGILLIIGGWVGENGFLFHTGASLTILAAGLTLRWLLTLRRLRPIPRDRIAYTFMGLTLLVYWSLPATALHDWFGVPEFGGGAELFFVGGLLMVAGAVWAVMYNADLLLGALTLVLGRVGRLRPILKTAVAYPMSAIFRTGMTIAMFALILFVLILMAVLVQVSSQTDPAQPQVSGGYQLSAAGSFANPIPDIRAAITAEPTLRGRVASVTAQTVLPLQARQPGAPPRSRTPTAEQERQYPGIAEGWAFYSARLVDDEFLHGNQFPLSVRARGYADDRAVWEAIARDPALVVVDALPVILGSAGDSGFIFGDAPVFALRDIDPGSPVMDATPVELRIPGAPGAGAPLRVTVIGVLSQEANYSGLYVAQALAQRLMPQPVPPSVYFFRAGPGENVAELRRALGAAFMDYGLEPVVIADEIRAANAIGTGFIGLLQGFMLLGLIVGIAALGVISTRAVVERRHEIGVLRSIGYRRSMIGATFLLESSFVALLGIAIGVGLGLLLSYNLIRDAAQETPTLRFEVPWLTIGGIVVLSYLCSLITTILPARSAARIYPAEALRYE